MRYKKTFLVIILISLFSFGCEKNPAESTAILPEVTTTNVTNITGTTAQCGGTIISDGGATITACGVCWSTGQTQTVSDEKTNDITGTSSFSSNLTSLTPGTTYYVRAYATNSVGTGYGSAISFTTLNLPILTTAEVSDITSTSAKCGGTISSSGGATVTACGVCWSTSQTPTVLDEKTNDVSGDSSYSSDLTGLTPGTTYYVRAYATNSVGTGYGNAISFTTQNIPVLITAEVSEITSMSAKCGGTISSDGGATVTACGVCWSTGQTPTVSDEKTNDETGESSFSSDLTGLTPGTTYYVRAYATNSVGTGYGNELSFYSEEDTLTITDVDGNKYSIIKIGNQWWMAENMKVTHYRNGDAIQHITDSTEWINTTSGGYCYYDNDADNATPYGSLYNWYSIDDSRKVAPEGWHVPSDGELHILLDYLGGEEIAGGKMKEIGIAHWISPNTGATNESGFSALPGGYRFSSNGYYDYMGYIATFWTSSEIDNTRARLRKIFYNDIIVGPYYGSKNGGFSVRCIKD